LFLHNFGTLALAMKRRRTEFTRSLNTLLLR